MRGFNLFYSLDRVATQVVLLLSLVSPSTAYSYTITTTSNGQPIRWRYGEKYYLAGNPKGRDSISEDLFRDAVVRGLQQWKWATHGIFDFDYWQGTDAKTFDPELKLNGLNSIFFASNANDPEALSSISSSVIGYTQVWFNDHTGDMVEADIVLNDRDFELTTNPMDTSMHPQSARPKVYLNNIITHEVGHAIGLSHSGNINSSMLYVEFSEQAKIGCDDWAGARHIYPVPNGGTGGLTGTVISPSGDPVSGAQVTAISKMRGIPIASVHTDQKGQFYFGALEAGDVMLMAAPFNVKNSSVIPARVQAKTDNYCGLTNYVTSFYTQDDGHTLKTIRVRPNSRTSMGTFQVQCEYINDSKELFQDKPATGSIVDIAPAASTKTYRFIANGPFELTGIAYLLMSPAAVTLHVIDASGKAIQTHAETPLYRSTSEYTIPDTKVTGTAYGEIMVQVSMSHEVGRYPGNSMGPDSLAYFVLNFFDGVSRSRSELPLNGRCAAPEHLPDYQSPGGSPVRDGTSSTTRDRIGFCGNAEAGTLHPSSRERAPLGSILGWFFPYLICFFGAFLHRRARLYLK